MLFVSYDFFDNDPSEAAANGIFQGDLPALVLVHGRGGFRERRWHLRGSVDQESAEALIAAAWQEIEGMKMPVNSNDRYEVLQSAPPLDWAAHMATATASEHKRETNPGSNHGGDADSCAE